MTHPPEDQPAMWLKQVPNNEIHADGTWAQRVLDAHHTVQRSREPGHGQPAICPACSARGTYGISPEPGQPGTVWRNTETGMFECSECHQK